ncbi:hypothetical protein C802_00567 [Phocaeicola sartorii]|uniref:Uncharacterized protein n=1 Tax=Phocaeicola sartorii TaxID=671267 RepID=R9IKY4_9BACT|nr:hypothetical protein C802_00567 [Phocaeicola sartorii]
MTFGENLLSVQRDKTYIKIYYFFTSIEYNLIIIIYRNYQLKGIELTEEIITKH